MQDILTYMIDEHDLESLEERGERESGAQDQMIARGDDDLEGDVWAERFGTSFVQNRYDVDDIDDDELERLEEEFFDAESGERTAFGDLEDLSDRS